MALHEIGFLIIGGALQCWFGSAVESSCPNAEKIKPAGITREMAGDFETREVHYEESGFAVFKREYDNFEIRKKSGTQFDPRVVEAFLKIIKKINTKVYLKQDEAKK